MLEDKALLRDTSTGIAGGFQSNKNRAGSVFALRKTGSIISYLLPLLSLLQLFIYCLNKLVKRFRHSKKELLCIYFLFVLQS